MSRPIRQIQYDIGELQRELNVAKDEAIQGVIEQTTQDILALDTLDERSVKHMLNDLKYKIVDIMKD